MAPRFESVSILQSSRTVRNMGRLLFCVYVFHILTFVLCRYDASKSEGFQLNKYNTYSDIVDYLKELEKYHKEVNVQAIGLTYEGRTIYMVKLSNNPYRSRRGIFVDANQHAREWVTSAIALNLIDNILRQPKLMDMVDWYIVPMANPDGYEFSRKHDREWRKNRSVRRGSDCIGVDLNRNYPAAWGLFGSSMNKCDYDIYAGPYPLSEAESQAISTTLRRNKKNIDLYITAHSFSGSILYPYGHTYDHPPNEAALKNLADKMSNAMEAVTGIKYDVKQSVYLYRASGGSDDFAYESCKIPYVYTVEFTKDHGFKFPENLLVAAFNESMAAFETAAEYIGNIGHG